ncbi:hypothetical protein V6N12_060967 [Hibiscus sabdariffa]|uniref:Uncharacterized protein n=1 Tax=Hibiscus sabdariffa TaxID=183260 RepID=A0ABR2DVN7_9ROSI
MSLRAPARRALPTASRWLVDPGGVPAVSTNKEGSELWSNNRDVLNLPYFSPNMHLKKPAIYSETGAMPCVGKSTFSTNVNGPKTTTLMDLGSDDEHDAIAIVDEALPWKLECLGKELMHWGSMKKKQRRQMKNNLESRLLVLEDGLGNGRIHQNIDIRYPKVADLIVLDSNTWDSNLLQSLFHPTIADRIRSIPLAKSKPNDEVVWRCDPTGEYSPKSGYRLLSEATILQHSMFLESRSSLFCSFYRSLWDLHMPAK